VCFCYRRRSAALPRLSVDGEPATPGVRLMTRNGHGFVFALPHYYPCGPTGRACYSRIPLPGSSSHCGTSQSLPSYLMASPDGPQSYVRAPFTDVVVWLARACALRRLRTAARSLSGERKERRSVARLNQAAVGPSPPLPVLKSNFIRTMAFVMASPSCRWSGRKYPALMSFAISSLYPVRIGSDTA
jgi:hypothetical protein